MQNDICPHLGEFDHDKVGEVGQVVGVLGPEGVRVLVVDLPDEGGHLSVGLLIEGVMPVLKVRCF